MPKRFTYWSLIAILIAGSVGVGQALQKSREYKSGVVWPEPKKIEPGQGNTPPSDAIILFDGNDLSQWVNGENWTIEDGYAIARKSGISTKQKFGDIQFHIEFATPAEVKGQGQGRGNSGVYFMGAYEVQILDSINNPTYFDGQCGAIYKQSPPMVNASREPGAWQNYDIVFEAPRFDKDGNLEKPAIMTVFHNGVLVQNHFHLTGGTFYDRPPAYKAHAETMPISLQFHGNPVRFRNIWVRPIEPIIGTMPKK